MKAAYYVTIFVLVNTVYGMTDKYDDMPSTEMGLEKYIITNPLICYAKKDETSGTTSNMEMNKLLQEMNQMLVTLTSNPNASEQASVKENLGKILQQANTVIANVVSKNEKTHTPMNDIQLLGHGPMEHPHGFADVVEEVMQKEDIGKPTSKTVFGVDIDDVIALGKKKEEEHEHESESEHEHGHESKHEHGHESEHEHENESKHESEDDHGHEHDSDDNVYANESDLEIFDKILTVLAIADFDNPKTILNDVKRLLGNIDDLPPTLAQIVDDLSTIDDPTEDDIARLMDMLLVMVSNGPESINSSSMSSEMVNAPVTGKVTTMAPTTTPPPIDVDRILQAMNINKMMVAGLGIDIENFYSEEIITFLGGGSTDDIIARLQSGKVNVPQLLTLVREVAQRQVTQTTAATTTTMSITTKSMPSQAFVVVLQKIGSGAFLQSKENFDELSLDLNALTEKDVDLEVKALLTTMLMLVKGGLKDASPEVISKMPMYLDQISKLDFTYAKIDASKAALIKIVEKFSGMATSTSLPLMSKVTNPPTTKGTVTLEMVLQQIASGEFVLSENEFNSLVEGLDSLGDNELDPELKPMLKTMVFLIRTKALESPSSEVQALPQSLQQVAALDFKNDVSNTKIILRSIITGLQQIKVPTTTTKLTTSEYESMKNTDAVNNVLESIGTGKFLQSEASYNMLINTIESLTEDDMKNKLKSLLLDAVESLRTKALVATSMEINMILISVNDIANLNLKNPTEAKTILQTVIKTFKMKNEKTEKANETDDVSAVTFLNELLEYVESSDFSTNGDGIEQLTLMIDESSELDVEIKALLKSLLLGGDEVNEEISEDDFANFLGALNQIGNLEASSGTDQLKSILTGFRSSMKTTTPPPVTTSQSSVESIDFNAVLSVFGFTVPQLTAFGIDVKVLNHPEVLLYLGEGTTDEIITKLQDGTIDTNGLLNLLVRLSSTTPTVPPITTTTASDEFDFGAVLQVFGFTTEQVANFGIDLSVVNHPEVKAYLGDGTTDEIIVKLQDGTIDTNGLLALLMRLSADMNKTTQPTVPPTTTTRTTTTTTPTTTTTTPTTTTTTTPRTTTTKTTTIPIETTTTSQEIDFDAVLQVFGFTSSQVAAFGIDLSVVNHPEVVAYLGEGSTDEIIAKLQDGTIDTTGLLTLLTRLSAEVAVPASTTTIPVSRVTTTPSNEFDLSQFMLSMYGITTEQFQILGLNSNENIAKIKVYLGEGSTTEIMSKFESGEMDPSEFMNFLTSLPVVTSTEPSTTMAPKTTTATTMGQELPSTVDGKTLLSILNNVGITNEILISRGIDVDVIFNGPIDVMAVLSGTSTYSDIVQLFGGEVAFRQIVMEIDAMEFSTTATPMPFTTTVGLQTTTPKSRVEIDIDGILTAMNVDRSQLAAFGINVNNIDMVKIREIVGDGDEQEIIRKIQNNEISITSLLAALSTATVSPPPTTTTIPTTTTQTKPDTGIVLSGITQQLTELVKIDGSYTSSDMVVLLQIMNQLAAIDLDDTSEISDEMLVKNMATLTQIMASMVGSVTVTETKEDNMKCFNATEDRLSGLLPEKTTAMPQTVTPASCAACEAKLKEYSGNMDEVVNNKVNKILQEIGFEMVQSNPPMATRYAAIVREITLKSTPSLVLRDPQAFNQWSEWSSCTASCDGGISIRMRTCTDDRPAEFCKATQTRECNNNKCEDYSPWSEWSRCTTSCGGGMTFRSRTCTHDKPVQDCEAAESKPCNTMACPPPVKIPRVWGQWENWQPCTVSCGVGTRILMRRCQDDYEEDDCMQFQTNTCDAGPCPIVRKWANWGKWTKCSVSCGTGVITRMQSCTDGLDPCTKMETAQCVLAPCVLTTMPPPMPTDPPSPSENIFNSWAEWGPCTRSSQGGCSQTRLRTCKNQRLASCMQTQSRLCQCQQPQVSIASWSEYSAWTQCTESCGVGTQQRSRTCSSGRGLCVGASVQVKSCVRGTCPPQSSGCPASEYETLVRDQQCLIFHGMSNGKKTYNEYRQYCNARNGRLVHIRTVSEWVQVNWWLQRIMKNEYELDRSSTEDVWFGITNSGTEGWDYPDKTQSYVLWGPGEPQLTQPEPHCVLINPFTGHGSSRSCNVEKHYAVCQYNRS